MARSPRSSHGAQVLGTRNVVAYLVDRARAPDATAESLLLRLAAEGFAGDRDARREIVGDTVSYLSRRADLGDDEAAHLYIQAAVLCDAVDMAHPGPRAAKETTT